MKIPQIRAAIAASLCTLATACSLFSGVKHSEPTPPPPPPPAPSEPEPVATQRFEVAPDEDVIGVVQIVKSSKEDTLTDIARRFNVGYEEILRANPKVDPWLPGADRPIVVPTQFVIPNAPRTGVVINIAAMRLFYFPPHKSGEPQVVITHPIGIGKVGWATPEGVTKIVRRQADPTWRVPVSVIKEHRENGEELEKVIGPGPDNPLGKFAFYLQWPSYLIHGTNKPAGVGLRSSHGCIRLYPEDIAQLFSSVPVGTQVRVVNQPFVFGWHDGQLYMQAFDVLEDDTRGWKKAPKKLLSQSLAANLQKQLKAHNEQVNWDEVTVLSHDPRGVPVPISLANVSLDQVLASASKVQNHLPDGSTWDGKSDLPMDEATFQQMVSEIEPGSSGGAPAASRAAPASAPTPGSTTPAGSTSPAGNTTPAGSTSPAGSTAPVGGATPAGSTTPARPGNTATSSPSTTPTTSAPAVKPRAAGPPVTSAAGSQSKSTQ
jgi:L,D-transpeptidase ErfK/SrfK